MRQHAAAAVAPLASASQRRSLVLAPLEPGTVPELPDWGLPLPVDPPIFHPSFAHESRAQIAWQEQQAAAVRQTPRTVVVRSRRKSVKRQEQVGEVPMPVPVPVPVKHAITEDAMIGAVPPGGCDEALATDETDLRVEKLREVPPALPAAAPEEDKTESPIAVTLEDIEARLKTSPAYQQRFKSTELGTCDLAGGTAVDPNGSFMGMWDSVLLLLLCYVSTWTPVEISFFGDGVPFGVVVFNAVVDCLFACDMLINSCMMYRDSNNQPVTAWRGTAWHYACTWFVPDLLSTFPVADMVDLLDGDGSHLRSLRLVRLVRLLKLARLLRASRLVQRFEAKTDLSYSVQSILKNGMMTLVVVHWAACLTHMTPALEAADTNWVINAALENGTVSDLYTASLMIGVIALPVGVPQVELPVTDAERGVSVLIMMLAGAVFAYAIGEISNLIINMDPATSEFQNAVDLTNQFIVENHIDPVLAMQMREYMHIGRPLFRSKFFSVVLTLMTPTLQEDVAAHMHGKWLSSIPFFRAPDLGERAQFIAAVARCLKENLFMPKELVIHSGEPSERMFVVKSGLVARLGCVFGAGRFVGDDIILRSSRRRYFVRSLTYANLQMLTRTQLCAILDSGDFPQTQLLIKKAATRLALRREMTRMADVLRAAKRAQFVAHMSSEALVKPVLMADDLQRSVHLQVASTQVSGLDARDTEARVHPAFREILVGMEVRVQRAAIVASQLQAKLLQVGCRHVRE